MKELHSTQSFVTTQLDPLYDVVLGQEDVQRCGMHLG